MISSNIWNFIRQGKDFYCHSKARSDNIMFNYFLLFQTKQIPPIFTVCMSGNAIPCQPYVIRSTELRLVVDCWVHPYLVQ